MILMICESRQCLEFEGCQKLRLNCGLSKMLSLLREMTTGFLRRWTQSWQTEPAFSKNILTFLGYTNCRFFNILINLSSKTTINCVFQNIWLYFREPLVACVRLHLRAFNTLHWTGKWNGSNKIMFCSRRCGWLQNYFNPLSPTCLQFYK